jgi:hypothetical protein
MFTKKEIDALILEHATKLRELEKLDMTKRLVTKRLVRKRYNELDCIIQSLVFFKKMNRRVGR